MGENVEECGLSAFCDSAKFHEFKAIELVIASSNPKIFLVVVLNIKDGNLKFSN